MDTTLLDLLGGRWPNDELRTESLEQAVSEIAGGSSLWKTLAIDPADCQALSQFALANGLTYTSIPNDFIDPSQSYTAAWRGLYGPLNVPQFVHEMVGTVLGYPARMCLEYRLSSFQQRNSNNHQYKLDHRSVIRVTLSKLFPQMVLDSNKNDDGVVSTIPTSIDPKQKVLLEGNFAHYFDFYAPQGVQSNSLSVLAPNFMETLINISATFDIEFYGNELILISKDPLYTPQVFRSAMKALEVQLQYLNTLIQSWNYVPLSPPFDHLKYSYFNGPTVLKVGPFRISPLGQIIGIGLLFVLFAVLILVTK